MELWIRSQDKKRLMKVAYLELEKDDYGFHILGREDKFSGNRLGTYKREEKALEVLDEIQNILSGSCLLKSYDNVTPEFSENIIINPCEVHIEQLNNYVYNMPKD